MMISSLVIVLLTAKAGARKGENPPAGSWLWLLTCLVAVWTTSYSSHCSKWLRRFLTQLFHISGLSWTRCAFLLTDICWWGALMLECSSFSACHVYDDIQLTPLVLEMLQHSMNVLFPPDDSNWQSLFLAISSTPLSVSLSSQVIGVAGIVFAVPELEVSWLPKLAVPASSFMMT